MLDRDTQNVDMLVRTLDVHMLEGTLRDYARPSPKCHAATFWQLRVRFRPYIASSVSVLVSVLGTRSASNPGPLAFVFLCFVLPLRWQNWFLVIFVYPLLFSISNLFPCLGVGVHRPLAFVFRLSLRSSRLVPFLFLASYGRGETICLPNSVFACVVAAGMRDLRPYAFVTLTTCLIS